MSMCPPLRFLSLTRRSMWPDTSIQMRTWKAGCTAFVHVAVRTVCTQYVVTRTEYWRIVHCEDDLSWALFYYAGAASAAGQVYTGAILATVDGAWPGEVSSEQHTVSPKLVAVCSGADLRFLKYTLYGAAPGSARWPSVAEAAPLCPSLW